MKKILIFSMLLGTIQSFACEPFVGTWSCQDTDGKKSVVEISASQKGIKIKSSNTDETDYFDGRPIAVYNDANEKEGEEAQVEVSCNGNQFTANIVFLISGEYKTKSNWIFQVDSSTLKITQTSKVFRVVERKEVEVIELRQEPYIATCTRQ